MTQRIKKIGGALNVTSTPDDSDAIPLGYIHRQPSLPDLFSISKDYIGRGSFRFITTKASGGPTFWTYLRSSTGYARYLHPDGTLGAVGGSGSDLTANQVIIPDMAAPYNTRMPRVYEGFPCNAAGESVAGAFFTEIQIADAEITAFDGSRLSKLTNLRVNGNLLTSLDLKGMPSLATLHVHANPITGIDMRSVSKLTWLMLGGPLMGKHFDATSFKQLRALHIAASPNLETVDISGLPLLNNFVVGGCPLLTSINHEGSNAFFRFWVSGSNLSVLDLSTKPLLIGTTLSNNKLTSLTLPPGWTGQGDMIRINNNLLNSASLDAIYTSLGTFSGGKGGINVSSNPGTLADNPTIATLKGWPVYGS